MAKVCSICGKGPIVRNQLVQSGKAKSKGGVGRKTTGITKTWKYPNLAKSQGVARGQRPSAARLHLVHPRGQDARGLNPVQIKPYTKA